MDYQELQEHEKILVISVTKRYKEDEQNRIIDDWHRAKSIIKLGKSGKYPEGNGLPGDGL